MVWRLFHEVEYDQQGLSFKKVCIIGGKEGDALANTCFVYKHIGIK
jgi:hypothetical protein